MGEVTATLAGAPAAADDASDDRFAAFVRHDADGSATLHMMVENMHCASCLQRVEQAFRPLPGVVEARADLSARRLRLRWREGTHEAGALARRLEAIGYRAVPYDPAEMESPTDAADAALLRSLAVAGFAAANVMLLSVAVWSGADEMGGATRDLLHWVSALIALPATVWAGRPFFRSALAALGARSVNMDVPISLALVLTMAVSLWETARGGEHVFFDAGLMLLFFLLVGRYLDGRARSRARSAAERLGVLGAVAARVVGADGAERLIPAREVRPGMSLLVAPGERIAADGTVSAGETEIDVGLLTGESAPQPAVPGDEVYAGTVNLTGALRLAVAKAGEDTLLAEIVRLTEAAEQRRGRAVRLADRAARFYAPFVHVAALATFLGWTLLGGMAWQPALLIAVSVLIITCPCAIGLAVPAVQIVASGRLLRGGILVKEPDALERLAAVDMAVFDKTGTLTLGRPVLADPEALDGEALALAARLAAASRHPLCRALVRAAGGAEPLDFVRETPGGGLAAATGAGEVRLGSRAWCGVADPDAEEAGESELWLARPGRAPVRFAFADTPRSDAAETLSALRAAGLDIALLSGDRAPAVRRLAERLGVAAWRAAMTPAAKAAELERLRAEGRTVLMVGDGLNDAPSLAAAAVSMSPAEAADVSRAAADLVFQGERLGAVVEAVRVARAARRVVFQNLAFAGLYNLICVPVAMAGLVTPLIAAAAMSASSIAVTLNALRLRGRTTPGSPRSNTSQGAPP